MSAQQHVDRFRLNRKRADNLRSDQPNDHEWAFVMYFYAALHLVSAYFVSRSPPIHIQNHRDRQIAIDKDTFLVSAIGAQYDFLRDLGHSVRYDESYVSAKGQIAQAAAKLAEIEKALLTKLPHASPPLPARGAILTPRKAVP